MKDLELEMVKDGTRQKLVAGRRAEDVTMAENVIVKELKLETLTTGVNPTRLRLTATSGASYLAWNLNRLNQLVTPKVITAEGTELDARPEDRWRASRIPVTGNDGEHGHMERSERGYVIRPVYCGTLPNGHC